MINNIRHWMNIVESVISGDLLDKISPFTERGKKNLEKINKIKTDIENEEIGLLRGFGKFGEFYDFNNHTNASNAERNEHYMLIDKLRKIRDEVDNERRKEIIKNKQERFAELDGFKEAGADEYKKYMDAVKKQVAKTASKQASKLSKQRDALSIMAKTKLR